MDAVRQYIFSVVCIAILCSFGQQFSAGNNRTVQFVAGLVMIVAVLGPLLKLDNISFDHFYSSITEDGDLIIAEGERIALQETSKYIKQETETYILNKASELGARVSVNVELSKDTPVVPVRVSLSGNISPYAKKCLMECIRYDLEINEENQIWIS